MKNELKVSKYRETPFFFSFFLFFFFEFYISFPRARSLEVSQHLQDRTRVGPTSLYMQYAYTDITME